MAVSMTSTRNDFDLYLTALNKSLDRTRNSFFVLIVITLTVIAVCQVLTPQSWQSKRRIEAANYLNSSNKTRIAKVSKQYLDLGLAGRAAVQIYSEELDRSRADENLVTLPILGALQVSRGFHAVLPGYTSLNSELLECKEPCHPQNSLTGQSL
jgi:hypothetical protein